jgi:hypothetical protein
MGPQIDLIFTQRAEQFVGQMLSEAVEVPTLVSEMSATSEERRFEVLLPIQGLAHESLVFGLAVEVLQQRVAHKVGVAEETTTDAAAEHVKGGCFVTQHGVSFSDFVKAFWSWCQRPYETLSRSSSRLFLFLLALNSGTLQNSAGVHGDMPKSIIGGRFTGSQW